MLNNLNIVSIIFLATFMMGCTQLSPQQTTVIPVLAEEESTLTDIFPVERTYISANEQKCQKVLTPNGPELQCLDGNTWRVVPSIYE